MEVAKACCYLGASLSGLIAHKLNGMPDKSFLNKMFLFYFAVDCIMGTLNTFLLFNVKLKRFDMMEFIKHRDKIVNLIAVYKRMREHYPKTATFY